MNNYFLVINAGSSSIKFAIFRTNLNREPVAEVAGQVDDIGNSASFRVSRANGEILADGLLNNSSQLTHQDGLTVICTWLIEFLKDGKLLAIGHRVVHGGTQYLQPVLVNEQVLHDLEGLIPLAPLHQPHNVAAIRATQGFFSGVPQLACFDTAFHGSQTEIEQRFALPRRFFTEGVRRYGFHGLSYEYIVSILPSLDPGLINARIIAAHLGNGASLCAIHKGRSIATTMGFSPLDGLVMGTRCGNLDPGVLLYLMEHEGMDFKALEHLLYYESGILGVSGISNDMRVLLARSDFSAVEAVELFVYRAAREIGSLSAALEGFDALIFTGGIGEHSASIRERICQRLSWLGLQVDLSANMDNKPKISAPASSITAWIVPANENLVIAKQMQVLCS
jgi:acetate kinase